MFYDPVKNEKRILDFWKAEKIFEKSLKATQKGRRFVFFEGPPTANGLPGIHHFLARTFKDLYGRYKTMRGFYVLRKAGWDTHGLPVEIEVEKQLGFKSKKDIDNYGIAEFNKKAKESARKYKKEWEEMTKRMGFWIDMDEPYITYDAKYMESVWQIIKQIWDKKLLYKAHRVVPFCVRCGTPLSSHEVAQGYKKIKEPSVYLKFRILNYKDLGFEPNTYILAWTTTPWTLPGNIALAVAKDIKYAVVKKGAEIYILAKELVEKVIDKPFSIEKEIKGSALIGVEYQPLFDIPELKSDKSYKVYSADFVATQEGTGVVHTAVMYGSDDYELGTKVGLPKIHTVDEQGRFRENVGNGLAGLYVKDKKTDELIIKKLKADNTLLKMEDYEHDYPFCWRCDSPLLYYAKDSWFIKMSAVNKQILANNEKINWRPEHIKEGRFGQWLKESKDWAFSRERYWGTPLPIWECKKCGHQKVIGSIKDLEKDTVKKGNRYFILRHGLSKRNENKDMIVNSHLDFDKYHLTDEGRKQVEKSVKQVKKLTAIDFIFVSPFIRTKETAEIAAKEFKLDIKTDERLGEIVGGLEFEGKSARFTDMKRREYGFDHNHNNGESWNEVRARLMDFVKEIESKYKDRNILIVSHGDPLWLFGGIASGLTAKEILEDNDGWYPKLGKAEELKWRDIPRNDLGELDLHRPFIDEVALKCPECGSGAMKKIPDLIDVWFDSGSMPFSQWHWPFENKKLFKEQFPADYISEGVDQTRGWFYTLLAISTLLGKGAPYKNVISLAHVLDEKGKKMSKSKGNVVSPFEVMDKFGADAPRWYFFTVNAYGEEKLFAMKDVQAQLRGFLATLHNCLRFYKLYENQALSFEPKKVADLLDKWILSKFNDLVQKVTDNMENYEPVDAARLIENFVKDDFSNWWLRRSRKRPEALGLLRYLLMEISKLCAPFIPFFSEDIHLELKSIKDEESVHLEKWPKPDKKLIDPNLEKEMVEVRQAATIGLAQRKEKQIKVRQPLRAIIINRAKNFDSDLEGLLKDELNVKEIEYKKDGDTVLDLNITLDLRDEGYARELMRQIQDIRKEAGYKFDQKVFGQWHSEDAEISSAINKWREEIKKETLLSDFANGPHDKKDYNVEKEFDLAAQKKIWIGVRK